MVPQCSVYQTSLYHLSFSLWAQSNLSMLVIFFPWSAVHVGQAKAKIKKTWSNEQKLKIVSCRVTRAWVDNGIIMTQYWHSEVIYGAIYRIYMKSCQFLSTTITFNRLTVVSHMLSWCTNTANLYYELAMLALSLAVFQIVHGICWRDTGNCSWN